MTTFPEGLHKSAHFWIGIGFFSYFRCFSLIKYSFFAGKGPYLEKNIMNKGEIELKVGDDKAPLM